MAAQLRRRFKAEVQSLLRVSNEADTASKVVATLRPCPRSFFVPRSCSYIGSPDRHIPTIILASTENPYTEAAPGTELSQPISSPSVTSHQ